MFGTQGMKKEYTRRLLNFTNTNTKKRCNAVFCIALVFTFLFKMREDAVFQQNAFILQSVVSTLLHTCEDESRATEN